MLSEWPGRRALPRRLRRSSHGRPRQDEAAAAGASPNQNYFRIKSLGGMSVPPALVRRMSRETGRPPRIRGDKTMRVMVLVKATKDSEAGMMPSTDLLEAMGKYNEELVNAGIMLAGEGLKPS